MIKPEFFVTELLSAGVDFFAGVPDSLLKSMCAYITERVDADRHVISANEGGAVALATGYHLATGFSKEREKTLLKADVESESGIVPVGDAVTIVDKQSARTAMLEVLSHDETVAAREIAHAVREIKERGDVFALVVEKDTFEPYALTVPTPTSDLELSREEAIAHVARGAEPDAVIVSTTGMISRELFEYRARKGEGHERDFLTVGSMGHASQIALGVAMQRGGRRVYCMDGDGAAIMHMGSMAIVGSRKPRNLVHIVFNNGAHDSVGGQPTVGFDIDLVQIATACGYRKALRIESLAELEALPSKLKGTEGPIFVEIRVRKGNRKDLGRPTTTPIENKEALMNFLKKGVPEA